MNDRWGAFVSTLLMIFAILGIAWQFKHYNDAENLRSSLAQSFLLGKQLAAISDITERDNEITFASGGSRHLDLILPKDARVFMPDLTGPTNYNKVGYYFYIVYYLFPREVGISLDQPARMTHDSFLGRTSDSDQEILAHGFDVRLDVGPDDAATPKTLRQLSIKKPSNPDWFDSNSDLAIAFLLPLLTAFAGMWLFRFLFPTLIARMPMLEQMAYGLGLGMMAVAALTLGIKLCGFSGRGLVFFATLAGTIAEAWHNRRLYLKGFSDGFWNTVLSPPKLALFAIGLVVFLILFRLAGLQGLVDPDAMRWMLKAKIIHLCVGSEIVRWFSNPAFGYAHLDYPILVPSLHAATFDSFGHVDEFVTKFWPTWMLFFLIAALASLNRNCKRWFFAPFFALLGVLLLPATQKFVQMEGSTIPMIFFTTLGFVQCGIWLVGKDRARLGLGLTFLFGAAMTTFQGFIVLALVVSWILLFSTARPSLKPSPSVWRVLLFCLLSTLPFLCLRLQIPVLNFESGWIGYAVHTPGITFSYWPCLVVMQFFSIFLNADFIKWSAEGGHIHWIGKWDGLSSLLNQSTLGMAWLCLLMTFVLWFAIPARRKVVVWMLAMFAGTVFALTGVYASFASVRTLGELVAFPEDQVGGRYILPMLLAWFATMMTMLFAKWGGSNQNHIDCQKPRRSRLQPKSP